MRERMRGIAAAALFGVAAAFCYAPEVCAAGNADDVADAAASVSGDTVIDAPGLGELTQEDYDELGSFTQELLEEYQSMQGESPVIVIREPEMLLSYDASTRRYRYTLPDGEWIECNIPQGAYYRGSVSFGSSAGLSSLAVMRDGAIYTGGAPYQENGSYVVTWWDLNVNGDADAAYRIDYVFTICSDGRMNLSLINAPLGMEITELYYKDKPQAVADRSAALLVRDGEYRLRFAGAGASYEMAFTRDTTPPVLELTPEYRCQETMTQTPRWQTMEPGTQVRIRRNYVDVELPYGEIPLNGYYEITATDAAGNARIYRFSVRAALPFFSPRLLVIPAAALIAVLIIVISTRRNMRVR